MISATIPNILSFIIYGSAGRPAHIEEVTPALMVFVGLITGTTTILLYGVVVNRLLIKRVKTLNAATKNVMQGDFSVCMEEQGQDELSTLIHNFNQMTNELKNNEYLNKEFVRNFSHELKTPLSAIKGYADLIKDGTLTNEEQVEYANIISEESNRLSDLSKSMLLISLVDSSGIIQKDEPYNLAEQIRNVIQISQLEWESKNIDLDIDMDEVMVRSNKEFTYQIWQNLFANAVEFSNESEAISLSLKEKVDSVIFTISNPGILSKEDQERVFDLFYILNKSKNKKSTGIGLTLTKKIVDKLKGRVTLSSENNLITFQIELPK